MDACTIVARNYLAHARTLAESHRRHHPESRFTVLVLDGPVEPFLRPDEPFELMRPDELLLPERELARMVTMYSVMELATAVKPALLRTLLRRDGGEIAYLDPDIQVFSRLDEIAALARAHGLVLTPHVTEPMPRDGLVPEEYELLRSGIYNLGFVAVGQDGMAFVDWWAERLARDCLVDRMTGLFVDQKWVDFAPGLFSHHILCDPGYNVAYWNLATRAVRPDGRDGYQVNGRPLRFFHYSGFSPDVPHRLSRYQGDVERVRLSEHAAVAELCRGYSARLRANGFDVASRVPCALDWLPEGLRLDARLRRIYRTHLLAAERANAPEPPTALDDDGAAFLAWLRQPADDAYPALSLLLLHVHREFPALRTRFRAVPGADAAEFVEWLGTGGAAHLDLPLALVLPAPARTGATAGDVRSFATLAFADELVAAPELLSAYARSFGAADDASLVIVVRGPELDALGAVLTTLGLDGDDGPDMVALTGDHDHEALTAKVDAVLSNRVVEGPLASRPRFGETDLALLRALAEGRSAAPLPLPSRPAEALEPGVNVAGYFRAELGVGEAARQLLAGVAAAGVPHATVTLGNSGNREQHAFVERGDAARFDTSIFCVNADQLPDLARSAHGRALAQGRYAIGLWWWELSRFPAFLHPAFDVVDEVWAGSGFVRDAIAAETAKPVHTFPLPVTVPAAGPLQRAQLGIPAGTLFLFAFDFNSVVARKNPGAVIEAYRAAFGRGDGAVLVIKTINGPQHAVELARLRAQAADRPDIVVLDGYLSTADKDALMAGSDCYVSLHRSEGFGLTMAEAMAYGRPVIATGYSGNLAYMDERNSLLVRHTLTPVPAGAGPYPAGVRWAEPDVAHASELLRRVADDPAGAAELGRRAEQHMLEHHSAAAAAAFVRARLAAIHGGREQRRAA